MGEVTGHWEDSIMRSFLLRTPHSTSRVIKWRRMRQIRHSACMGGNRKICRDFVGKSEDKRPL
jgi:hypothetical protein